MALFKPFRGNRASLAAQPLRDGYAYFCTDDGSFHIDYVDADGNLQRKQVNESELEALNNYDKQIGEEITPLTDEEVDSLWADTPGTGETPTFSMTSGFVPVWNGATFEDGIALDEIGGVSETQVNEIVDTKIDTFNTNTVQPQKMNFAYYSDTTLVANSMHPIKSNGYYMCFCNNAKLKLCNADGSVQFEGAKQIMMLTAPGSTSTNANKFKACGQYWTGSTNVFSGIPVEGFRRTLNTGAYITADEEFAVCQMVQGN